MRNLGSDGCEIIAWRSLQYLRSWDCPVMPGTDSRGRSVPRLWRLGRGDVTLTVCLSTAGSKMVSAHGKPSALSP